MPNLSTILSDEIRRLARKEIRAACNPLQNQVRDLKKTLRLQRDTIASLEKTLRQLNANAANTIDKITSVADSEETSQIRLNPTSIKKHRKRLKLSQGQLGKLLNVSTNTVVRWEAGTSKPRATHRPDIAKLRTMGLREVRKLLES